MQNVFRQVKGLIQCINEVTILRYAVNAAFVGLLALVLLTAWVPTAFGELPLVKLWQHQLQKTNPQVQRLGNIETAPVEFEGTELFTVASPTVWDRTKPAALLPVENRVEQIEANLNRVIEGSFLHKSKDGILTNFDPKTLQVSVVSLNDVPVLIAGDGYHSQPLKLVTVTYVDADYNGQPVADLAEQWRSIVYQHLYEALMQRSPDALSPFGKLGESLLALGITLGASLVLWLLQLPLKQRNRRLRLQQSAVAAENNFDSNSSSEQNLMQLQSSFLDGFEQQWGLQQRRSLIGFFRWLLAWGQVIVWVLGLTVALAIFPWTRQYTRHLGTPVTLLAIWFLTSWVSRLVSALLHSLASAWVRFGTAASEPQRDRLRIFTILSAVKPLKTFVVYACGITTALVYLQVPLLLLLTIGGIVGLSVLLVCQGFVRDWLTGCLILWEDQYAIGDVIATGNYAGLVEKMNLRLTQLRDDRGQFISIANSTIMQVANLTRSRYQRRRETTPRVVHANPFNGTDPFNGIDPLGGDATEPTASKG